MTLATKSPEMPQIVKNQERGSKQGSDPTADFHFLLFLLHLGFWGAGSPTIHATEKLTLLDASSGTTPPYILAKPNGGRGREEMGLRGY